MTRGRYRKWTRYGGNRDYPGFACTRTSGLADGCDCPLSTRLLVYLGFCNSQAGSSVGCCGEILMAETFIGRETCETTGVRDLRKSQDTIWPRATGYVQCSPLALALPSLDSLATIQFRANIKSFFVGIMQLLAPIEPLRISSYL